jgi:hypothetical protein
MMAKRTTAGSKARSSASKAKATAEQRKWPVLIGKRWQNKEPKKAKAPASLSSMTHLRRASK